MSPRTENVIMGTGDIIGEINYLKYDTQQSKQPLYSYNSSRFNAVMKGQKIISGAFSINFIHPNYLIAQIIANVQTTVQSDPINSLVKGSNNITTKMDVLKHLRAQLTYGGNLSHLQAALGELGMEVRDSPGAEPEDDILDLLPSFNIQITYSNISNQVELISGNGSSTKRTISTAHLTSFGQEYQPSGEPLQEVYTFFARSLYNDLGGT